MSDQVPPPSGQFPPRRESFSPHVGQPSVRPTSATVRNVVIAAIILGVLACGGCLAFSGVGSDGASNRAPISGVAD
ncbi:hypothetical protein [Nocardioides daejeonensis]|uniref:hypothetical protein n=1 Tax=Nocardioides daejeonensis TaxID=1046556 RepID=UPI000D74B623|nr:hypothetical protein [Nocardioides daejeonensis]